MYINPRKLLIQKYKESLDLDDIIRVAEYLPNTCRIPNDRKYDIPNLRGLNL